VYLSDFGSDHQNRQKENIIMPTPEQILSGLREITNSWRVLAIVWHVYFAAIAIGLLAGIRPPKNLMGVLLGLPLLSVSFLAWRTSNPFNGIVFGLAGIILIGLAARLTNEPIEIAPTWLVIPGAAMFLFGWVYPHFLTTGSFTQYLYAAPTGLIPCPTLSIVIGLALIVGGFGSGAWTLVLGVVGIFYGIFGTVRLGVTIDWVLMVGALMISVVALFGNYREAWLQFGG
jgi:hypothetical protein